MPKTEKQRAWAMAQPLFRKHHVRLNYREASRSQIVHTYNELLKLEARSNSSSSSSSSSSHAPQPARAVTSALREKRRIPVQRSSAARSIAPCYWPTNLVEPSQQKGVNDLVAQQRAYITSMPAPSPTEVVQTHWRNTILSADQLRDFVTSVWQQQQRSCKMNVSLGLVLYYPDRQQFQLVDATKSDLHFFEKQRPPLITSQADLEAKILPPTQCRDRPQEVQLPEQQFPNRGRLASQRAGVLTGLPG